VVGFRCSDPPAEVKADAGKLGDGGVILQNCFISIGAIFGGETLSEERRKVGL